MKIKKSLLLFTILIISGIAIALLILKPKHENDWNQFRGNQRSGTTVGINIMKEWPDNGLESVWKQNIGSSFAEVLITKDRIYTMSSDSLAGAEYMVSYESKTGNEIWKTYVDSIFIDLEGWGHGPRSTPAMDNKAVYCLSSFGKLTALSIKDGAILWTVNIAKEFESDASGWTYTTSPLILDDVLILEVGGKDSKGFAAFDKKTGDTKWIKGNGKPSYSSPTLAVIDGIEQVIFANDTLLFSFDKNGNQLWSFKMPQKSPTATPLFIAPNKIFISVMTGNFMVEVNNNAVKEVFQSKSMKNVFSTSCHYNGYIYGFSYDALQCISTIDGKLKWSEKGFGFGSLINIGNSLLVITDKGVLKLIEAIPDKYSEKGSFQALMGKSWTAPSFANDCVYLRNLSEIAAYKIKNDD